MAKQYKRKIEKRSTVQEEKSKVAKSGEEEKT
jgi:hypothetical protein